MTLTRPCRLSVLAAVLVAAFTAWPAVAAAAAEPGPQRLLPVAG